MALGVAAGCGAAAVASDSGVAADDSSSQDFNFLAAGSEAASTTSESSWLLFSADGVDELRSVLSSLDFCNEKKRFKIR